MLDVHLWSTRPTISARIANMEGVKVYFYSKIAASAASIIKKMKKAKISK
jgi:hypothetical protein